MMALHPGALLERDNASQNRTRNPPPIPQMSLGIAITVVLLVLKATPATPNTPPRTRRLLNQMLASDTRGLVGRHHGSKHRLTHLLLIQTVQMYRMRDRLPTVVLVWNQDGPIHLIHKLASMAMVRFLHLTLLTHRLTALTIIIRAIKPFLPIPG